MKPPTKPITMAGDVTLGAAVDWPRQTDSEMAMRKTPASTRIEYVARWNCTGRIVAGLTGLPKATGRRRDSEGFQSPRKARGIEPLRVKASGPDLTPEILSRAYSRSAQSCLNSSIVSRPCFGLFRRKPTRARSSSKARRGSESGANMLFMLSPTLDAPAAPSSNSSQRSHLLSKVGVPDSSKRLKIFE